MNKKKELFIAIALFICTVFLVGWGAIFVQKQTAKDRENYLNSITTEKSTSTESQNDSTMSSFCIVIDAGHGGADPGKVGVTGILEKDLNLSIALLLAQKLESAGISVILTRDTDTDLSGGASNFKSADMRNRNQIIMESNPVFTISIHQNSYPDENITGAQVFYFTHSSESKNLATILQNSLISNLDPSNTRQPKANESYYLLKKTPTPTVIVECGFLSSPNESALLCTPEYQEKVVYAIYLGTIEYLKEKNYL